MLAILNNSILYLPHRLTLDINIWELRFNMDEMPQQQLAEKAITQGR